MQEKLTNTFKAKVAVFPLPDIAVLPGEVVPLHIFEPRYRRMIDDILEHDYLLGVSLAGKVLHAPEIGNSEDLTKRNLTLYEPNTIFGCGPVILRERLADGRLIIDLHVQHKVEIAELMQELPYYLTRVRPLPDIACDQQAASDLTQNLSSEFIQLARGIDQTAAQAIEHQTRDIDLAHLIALVLSVVRFPGEFKQELLEQNHDLVRGEILLKKLPELFPHITH